MPIGFVRADDLLLKFEIPASRLRRGSVQSLAGHLSNGRAKLSPDQQSQTVSFAFQSSHSNRFLAAFIKDAWHYLMCNCCRRVEYLHYGGMPGNFGRRCAERLSRLKVEVICSGGNFRSLS